MPSGIYVRTEKTLRKLREIQKRLAFNQTGSKRPNISGENNPSKRPEVRAKISRALKGRPSINKGKSNYWLKGNKSPFWIDGRAMDRKAYKRKHRENNRESYNFSVKKRHRSKVTNGGTHTLKEWHELKKKYNNMCLCCKRFEPEITLTEDHVIPIFHGGTDFIDNIQPLCKSCNSSKYINSTDYRFPIKI